MHPQHHQRESQRWALSVLALQRNGLLSVLSSTLLGYVTVAKKVIMWSLNSSSVRLPGFSLKSWTMVSRTEGVGRFWQHLIGPSWSSILLRISGSCWLATCNYFDTFFVGFNVAFKYFFYALWGQLGHHLLLLVVGAEAVQKFWMHPKGGHSLGENVVESRRKVVILVIELIDGA